MPACQILPAKRAMPRIAAALLAAGALGLAAAAVEGEILPVRGAPARAAGADRSLLETLALLRWGYGALDWLLPDQPGDPNDRDRRHAG